LDKKQLKPCSRILPIASMNLQGNLIEVSGISALVSSIFIGLLFGWGVKPMKAFSDAWHSDAASALMVF